MDPYTEHASALVELQNEMDVCPTIVWQAKTVKVLPGSISLRATNSDGGLSLDADFACSVLASDMGAQPTANQIIIHQGKRLRIESVSIAAGGLQYRITANHAAQGL